MTRAEHPLLRLTGAVRAHRSALLSGYEPIDLHQFRVHVRRIRSWMKTVPGCQDRGLRAAWREIFVSTNPARDRDVFDAAIAMQLPGESGTALRAVLAPLREAAQAHVVERLGSTDWLLHDRAWTDWLAGLADFTPAVGSDALPDLKREVRLALDQAREQNDRRAWHRLRIAIKNLRYVADIPLLGAAGPGIDSGPQDPLITACKRLQDLLGEWHDCMVQLELLDEATLRRAPVRAREQLAAILVARRDALLGEARELLDEQREQWGRSQVPE